MPLEVALVAMPWPLADRPSIQLATLKAYLHQQFQDTVHVRAFHPYLAVAAALGLDRYQSIAERSWLAESLYALLLFPERLPHVEALIPRAAGGSRALHAKQVAAVCATLRRVHEQSTLWNHLGRADVIGISVCLAQLTSSLYLAREVKRRFPQLPVVFGGSGVSEELGRSLLEVFPDIDYIVNGEGERPLAALVDAMRSGRVPAAENPPGVFWRNTEGKCMGEGKDQVSSLDSLPLPDYLDYFAQLSRHPALAGLIVSLPVESSRGCFWQARRAPRRTGPCQFCNLNLQWHGYRTKGPGRVAEEMRELARRHKTVRFCFVDNTLSPALSESLFEEIHKVPLAFQIFVELRAPLSRRHFQTMQQAGVREVQIGIEALGSRLLTKMGKGTRAIDNVAMMKRCEEFRIRNQSNLLLEFPGSDREDVAQTLATIDFVECYQPLRTVRFWLGEGSPIEREPRRYGLSALRNHPWYAVLFPPERLRGLCLMQKSYRGDREKQTKLWRPVMKRVKMWRCRYAADRRQYPEEPLLGYSDGGTFLVIRRRRSGSAHHEAHRLVGISREIFLYCDTTRTFQEIMTRFPRLKSQELQAFLDDLAAKRLMYGEDGSWLSLAVDEDPRRFCRGGLGE
jgi:ribosomal peptide maturation radical SAM protein 1